MDLEVGQYRTRLMTTVMPPIMTTIITTIIPTIVTTIMPKIMGTATISKPTNITYRTPANRTLVLTMEMPVAMMVERARHSKLVVGCFSSQQPEVLQAHGLY